MLAPTLTRPLRNWLNSQFEPTGEPNIDGRIRADQIGAALRFMYGNMIVNILNAVIVVIALWNSVPRMPLLAWSACVLAYALRILLLSPKIRRAWPAKSAGKRVIASSVVHSAILGTTWGVLPAIWFPLAGHENELLIGTIITGMIGAGAYSLSSLPMASVAYVVPMTLGAYVGMFRSDVTHLWPVAILLALYSAIIIFTVQRMTGFFTERTVAEQAVKERGEVIELLLREFQENGSDWLYELDADLRIVGCSPRMCAVTGMSEDALRNRSLPDMLCPGYREDFRGRTAGSAAFESFACQVVFEDRSRWWSLSASPILDGRGKITGWRGVGSDITEEKLAKDRIVLMAQSDSLTGLHNRFHFRELAEAALERTRHTSSPLAIGCLDLDHFKEVNDTLGHPVGDELLKALAVRLRALSSEGVTFGRFGGDEFGIMIEGAGDRERVAGRLRRIIDAVSEPVALHGDTIAVGGTIGVTFSDDDEGGIDAMIRNADLALYAAKTASRGTVGFYDASMFEAAEEQRMLREDMRTAISEGQLRLEYQPIVDIASHAVTGFEALLRWDHPRLGTLGPDRFIDLAETAGMIGPIGDWVLGRACKDAMGWPDDIRVAVNISPAQFGGGSLAASVRTALRESGLPVGRLELEITEAIFVKSEMMAEKFIAEMAALGVDIALDDFGTGYSSLAYLTRFPVQKLKIDRSFVSGQRAFKERNAIVSAVVGIARTLNMTTTAEGVETAGELAWVTGLGCRQVQGYYFARPMNIEAVGPFIESFGSRHPQVFHPVPAGLP